MTKTADVTTASPGDVVTYTITIENTGDVNLNSITVSDPLLGGTLSGFPASLAPGASASNTFTYTVQLTDANPLVNTVIFTGHSARALTPQSTTATASVVDHHHFRLAGDKDRRCDDGQARRRDHLHHYY